MFLYYPKPVLTMELVSDNSMSNCDKVLGSLLAAKKFKGYADPLKVFFAEMLYARSRTIGLDYKVEDSSDRDRSDMKVFHGGQVFVFEFKMANGEGDQGAAVHKAVEQIQEKGYADKYLDWGEPVHLVGVSFSQKTGICRL